MSSIPTVYFYQAYGLVIRSPISLPDLPRHAGAVEDPVIIRRGPLPRLPRPRDAVERCVCTHAEASRALFSWPDSSCWFRVADGREITIDAEAQTTEACLRLFIMGIGMATILHQRGRLVLHASAVLIKGQAIAFIGASGYGKSTMAAALRARGHDTLADDFVAIAIDALGRVTMAHGGADLRLWPESAAWLGLDPTQLPRVHPAADQRSLCGPRGTAAATMPLVAIVALADGERIAIETLAPTQAFLELVRHSFCGHLLDCGGSVSHLEACAEITRRIPIRTLTRPFTFAHLAAAADAIESYVTLHLMRSGAELEPQATPGTTTNATALMEG